ncbi:hypothetical protein IFM89_023307 [Coptis chinensis]|uniref:Uncharacterized protein n=1 Tax=Coptis chinensis TaxID=261450 RepID=A0A835LBJ9_9MAGN|nr:hypothetical protein IFM89_023307 [Coptis chinensis]
MAWFTETLSGRTSCSLHRGKLKLADFGLAAWWIPTVGVLPFEASSMEELREAHKKKKLNLNSVCGSPYRDPFRDLVRRMLTWDVSSRLTADEVLSHPWFMFHKEQSLKPTWNMVKKRKVLEDLSNQLASPRNSK